MEQWRGAGIGRARVELVDEGPSDTEKVVRSYIDVLEGRRKPKSVWKDLMQVRDSNGRESGVSLGSFNNKTERRAGEVQ